MSTALEYLRNARDTYVEQYRSVLHAKRREGAQCTPEVWVDPNLPPGKEKLPHPVCIDIMVQGESGPGMLMVAREAIEGRPVGVLPIGRIPVEVYEAIWEDFPVWVRHSDPHWADLEPWRKRWMDYSKSGDADEDGLAGLVHHIGRPVAEGGGFLYQMDFGSAPVEALTELLQALAEMGASEIELGRSDGSHLPASVREELQRLDLSLERLAGLLAGVLSELDEVDKVEQRKEGELTVYMKGCEHERHVFLGNLYQLLQRVGVEARAKEVARFLRGQRELMVPAVMPDLSQLRLLIKDNRFFQDISQYAPKMKPLVKEPLVGDAWVVCVWDAPNGMAFATEDQPELYGLTIAQMLARAKENYLKARPAVEMSQDGSLLVARTRDCYDATLLVDDQWCAETAARVSGELLACVPARDFVLIGGRGCAGTVAEMHRAAQRIQAGGDHLITGTIFVRRAGGWQVFEEVVAPTVQTPKKPWWRF